MSYMVAFLRLCAAQGKATWSRASGTPEGPSGRNPKRSAGVEARTGLRASDASKTTIKVIGVVFSQNGVVFSQNGI